MSSKKILYITYDGLTDPLGQSQILPYLVGLAASGYQFTILSFEKKDRLQANGQLIRKIVTDSGIDWVPLIFSRNPPLLSKFYDALRMRQKAVALHRMKRFDMVHCRSYIAADVGLKLKKQFGVKFFFDMRGFWADEKRDGGSWTQGHPVFDRVYRYYKKKEAEYLRHADYIVSLTHAGKKEMEKWPAYRSGSPVSVIPCCADTTLFTLTGEEQKTASKKALGINQDTLVISYLGSVGAWYMLDEMLLLFVHIRTKYPSAIFLFVSHSDPKTIRSRAGTFGIPQNQIIVKEASRKEVPVFMKASDINIFFIRPVYSKISSSPTKLGEVLSMGIPVIANAGVGDVKDIVEQAGAGFVMNAFEERDFEEAVSHIPALLKLDPALIRERAFNIYDLGTGISLYNKAYEKVLN